MLRIYKIILGLPLIAVGLKIIIQQEVDEKPIWFLKNVNPNQTEITIIGILLLAYGLYSVLSYFRNNTHIVNKFVTPGLLILTIFTWVLFILIPVINYVIILPFLIKIIVFLLTVFITSYFHYQLKYVQNEKKISSGKVQ